MRILKIILFAILLFSAYASYSQNYQYNYRLSLDSSFGSYDDGKNAVENYTQSYFRTHYMDSTVFNCTGNDTLIHLSILTKMDQHYLKTRHADIFYEDSLAGGISGNGYAHIDTANVTAKTFLVDKKKAISYDFISGKCKLLTLTHFIPTKTRKKIDGWHCTKWIPADADISNEVAVWICDDIPGAISLNYISDDFTGGIVQVSFRKGIHYTLTGYEQTHKLPEDFYEPVCDHPDSEKSNFINDLLKNKVLLELKYEFK